MACGRAWHHIAALLGVSLFATLMMIATFLHWDNFNHEHVAFFTLLLLYVATPFVMPLLYARNRGADAGVAIGAAAVPTAVRIPTGSAAVRCLRAQRSRMSRRPSQETCGPGR